MDLEQLPRSAILLWPDQVEGVAVTEAEIDEFPALGGVEPEGAGIGVSAVVFVAHIHEDAWAAIGVDGAADEQSPILAGLQAASEFDFPIGFLAQDGKKKNAVVGADF